MFEIRCTSDQPPAGSKCAVHAITHVPCLMLIMQLSNFLSVILQSGGKDTAEKCAWRGLLSTQCTA